MDKFQSLKIIWDYMKMGHKLEKADCIMVLGSHDTRVAERGAEVYQQGWGDFIVFSGYLGAFTSGVWKKSEAEIFAEIAINMGVPKEKIILEDKSTNTGENIRFTRELLLDKKLLPDKIIAVNKPYMERRTYAAFKKFWPEPWLSVTSPQLSFDEYMSTYEDKDKIIDIMVGDLHRIMLYPERGYQIPQVIPPDVIDAFDVLVGLGYSKRLVGN